jgi:hypothetical protein
MYSHLGYADSYIRSHVAELLREAENDRLADLAIGPGRPWRERIADRLIAIAEWVDGRPRGSISRAEVSLEA